MSNSLLDIDGDMLMLDSDFDTPPSGMGGDAMQDDGVFWTPQLLEDDAAGLFQLLVHISCHGYAVELKLCLIVNNEFLNNKRYPQFFVLNVPYCVE